MKTKWLYFLELGKIGLSISARSVQKRFTDLTETVTSKQTNSFKQTEVFGVALDKNTDFNDLSCLSILQHIIFELIYVTTGGTAAMGGKGKEFVKLREDHFGHKLLDFYCIIHNCAWVQRPLFWT